MTDRQAVSVSSKRLAGPLPNLAPETCSTCSLSLFKIAALPTHSLHLLPPASWQQPCSTSSFLFSEEEGFLHAGVPM